jgi:hypothetical protein
MTKPLGIIRHLNIQIHGIPYVATFIVLQNGVVDSRYSMLLGRPWLKTAKVTHDWGNNAINVQSNGIVKTILVNKKIRAKTKRPQTLVYYALIEGLTDEEEDLIFEIEPWLFLTGTITILHETISLLTIRVIDIRIKGKFEP